MPPPSLKLWRTSGEHGAGSHVVQLAAIRRRRPTHRPKRSAEGGQCHGPSALSAMRRGSTAPTVPMRIPWRTQWLNGVVFSSGIPPADHTCRWVLTWFGWSVYPGDAKTILLIESNLLFHTTQKRTRLGRDRLPRRTQVRPSCRYGSPDRRIGPAAGPWHCLPSGE